MRATSDRRRTGLFAVGFFLGACGLILGMTDWNKRLSTRVLDLLPIDETSIEARLLAGYLQEKQGDQVIFALGGIGADEREGSVEDLLGRLEGTGQFESGISSDREVFDRVGSHLFENRLSLFFPAWLARYRAAWEVEPVRPDFPVWLARKTVGELDLFLQSPEGFFYADGVPADPLLILPMLWNSLPGWEADAGSDWTILTARLKGSAFEDSVQEQAVPAISRVQSEWIGDHPGSTLLATGPVLFASASRIAIRAEVERLNLATLVAVFAVILIALRRPLGLLAMVPMVLCGLAGGLVATLLVFGSIHVVMLVLGAFMAGITVDYGFHAFLHPTGKGRSLWKPLSAAAGSTAVGFLALLFGTLPVVRQLGLFIGAGVLSALFAAYCLRPVFPADLMSPRSWVLRANTWNWRRSIVLGGLLIVLMGAVAGTWQIEWRDDIRELDLPSENQLFEDARIREVAGMNSDQIVLLTTGSTFLEAIDAWRALNRAGAATGAGPLAGMGPMLPSSEDLESVRSFMNTEAAEWVRLFSFALDEAGYAPEAFVPFFQAFARLNAITFSQREIEARLVSLSDTLAGPVGLLLPSSNGLYAVTSFAAPEADGWEDLLPGHPETVPASQLEGLNDLFAHYRQEGWNLVLIGFLVIAAAVVAIFGFVTGPRILALPVSGVLITFGLLGWLHRDLNLFHLLAGLLGFCLALDHALFAGQARSRNKPPPASVRISALTTIVAFGVLATSHIPAVSALGWTVASAVAVTGLLIEIFAATRPRSKQRKRAR